MRAALAAAATLALATVGCSSGAVLSTVTRAGPARAVFMVAAAD